MSGYATVDVFGVTGLASAVMVWRGIPVKSARLGYMTEKFAIWGVTRFWIVVVMDVAGAVVDVSVKQAGQAVTVGDVKMGGTGMSANSNAIVRIGDGATSTGGVNVKRCLPVKLAANAVKAVLGQNARMSAFRMNIAIHWAFV
jgi:hypothetical protein